MEGLWATVHNFHNEKRTWVHNKSAEFLQQNNEQKTDDGQTDKVRAGDESKNDDDEDQCDACEDN